MAVTAESISLSVLALSARNSRTLVREAISISLVSVSALGFFGFTTRAMAADDIGIISLSSSKRLAMSVLMKSIIPVILPPGRLRLGTKPVLTGSSPITNKIGIVDVAAFAAKAETAPPLTTMTATPR